MKQRKYMPREEVCECPKCKATCLVGHDEDGQVYCANCSNSFRPSKTKTITEKKLRQLYANAERRDKSGWTAFIEKK